MASVPSGKMSRKISGGFSEVSKRERRSNAGRPSLQILAYQSRYHASVPEAVIPEDRLRISEARLRVGVKRCCGEALVEVNAIEFEA
jgi:hypothetical protein